MCSAPISNLLRTAVCVGQWLPASETFIYDQLIHQKRTIARVLARDRTDCASRFPYDDVVHLGAMQTIGFYHFGFAPKVRKALLEHRTALIHAHFGPNGVRMLPFAHALRIPLVVSMHGHDVGGLESQNRHSVRYRKYQRMAPELFEKAALFLCASEELAALLIGHGAPASKVQLHHLGVDLERFRPGAPSEREAGRILMVGRLVEKKGMADGMEALRRVVHNHGNAHLVIVGDGPLREELRDYAIQLGLADRVQFLGSLSQDGVLREMQRAAILLTPSFTTPSGDRESGVIVVKEAGATGLPAVVTRHGGLPEIIDDGENGFVVTERDVASLAERLERLLTSAELRMEMGQRARRLVERRYDTVRQNELLEEHLLRAASAG